MTTIELCLNKAYYTKGNSKKGYPRGEAGGLSREYVLRIPSVPTEVYNSFRYHNWIGLNWLFNVTINDISVIYATAHRCGYHNFSDIITCSDNDCVPPCSPKSDNSIQEDQNSESNALQSTLGTVNQNFLDADKCIDILQNSDKNSALESILMGTKNNIYFLVQNKANEDERKEKKHRMNHHL